MNRTPWLISTKIRETSICNDQRNKTVTACKNVRNFFFEWVAAGCSLCGKVNKIIIIIITRRDLCELTWGRCDFINTLLDYHRADRAELRTPQDKRAASRG